MKALFYLTSFFATLYACANEINNLSQKFSNDKEKRYVFKPVLQDTAKNRDHLTGTWVLTRMHHNKGTWSKEPELSLNVKEGTFTAVTSCLGINGRFLVKGSSVTFDNEIISSKMNCDRSEDEETLLKSLLRVNNYAINDSTLQFKQLDTVKLVFKRQPL